MEKEIEVDIKGIFLSVFHHGTLIDRYCLRVQSVEKTDCPCLSEIQFILILDDQFLFSLFIFSFRNGRKRGVLR